MANSNANIGKKSRTVTLASVLLLAGGLVDLFMPVKAVVISEPLALFLIGTGLIMIGKFGKRFIK